MKKKIHLIRASSSKFGGAENYLYRLSKALHEVNLDHVIIHSSLPRIMPSWLRALIFNLQLSITKKGKFYYSLDRITCPDLYRAGDGVHKVFLSIENKSKLNPLHPIYLYLEKQCFKNSKYIIANSNMIKDQIINSYDINPNKIYVIHNGIEFKKSNYDKSFKKLSNEFLIDKNQSVILYVGSGFKRKGVKEFLKIFSKLHTKNIVAFIIGKEKNIKYYENLSIELKIQTKVFFTGPRLDVDDFYTISDVFLFPTHYDPFSNVVLEAMNFNNAVFTTKFNGASEILENNFIMDSPNDETVISSIDKLLKNKSALNKTKIINKRISKKFSIENNLNKTLEVINQIEQKD